MCGQKLAIGNGIELKTKSSVSTIHIQSDCAKNRYVRTAEHKAYNGRYSTHFAEEREYGFRGMTCLN